MRRYFEKKEGHCVRSNVRGEMILKGGIQRRRNDAVSVGRKSVCG